MALDDKKKKDSGSWEEVRVTSTQTEVLTHASVDTDDLMGKASKLDPALIVVQGEMLGKVFRLKEGISQIGRQPDNAVVIQQRAVSGHHAQVRREGGTVILEDLKSTNGTILNKDKIERPQVLQQNDLIKIGTCVFKYSENQLDTSFTESLHHKGSTDELTGVYNKAYLMSSLASAIEVAKSGFPLSVVIFDLDHFKRVNDTYGHIAGDYVLKETTRLIKDTVVRSEDILGRWGGEEFLLIMPDAKLEVAVGVAERIRKTMEMHDFVFSGMKIPVTASLGVSMWIPQLKTAEDFLEAADQLLYKSKQEGRNRVSFKRP
jgi:two-component system, cell cycle response regulator